MKTRNKLLISVIAGLLAMMLASPPMWWGVLFSPITKQLACVSLTKDTEDGWRWESEGVVFRFKSFDLLFSFLQDL